LNENQSNSIKKVNEYHFSDQEFYSSESQQQKFKSFYYSFGNNSNIKLKKPSILKIILLLPFIILGLLFLLIIGLIMFVIFLPKIFNIFRKKGISGLKMDYNLIRGLFSQIRTK
jgi:cytoskeletal protein RodZ